MFGGIDPKKIQSMMKQMGINQQEIDAEQVIIKKSDNTRIIINNPSVMKINMQGNVNFQVSGDITEQAEPEETSEDKTKKHEEDIKTIMEQTNCTKKQAQDALAKFDGDIAEAIISLS